MSDKHRMSINRFARRVDANQDAVVSALRAAGARVEVISRPVDLLVGIRGKLALFEIKDGDKVKSAQKKTSAQEKFFAEWAGYPIGLVDGPEAALRMLAVMK